MTELILFLILIVSLIGMIFIAFSKISLLKKVEVIEKDEDNFFSKIKEKTDQNLERLKSNSWDTFLQKIISKIKIFSLRIERRCSNYLEVMRQRTRKKKENEKYWDKVKRTPLESEKED